MKKILIFLTLCSMLYALCLASPVNAANKFWWASCRTGGGDCLDGIDGNDLTAGDGAIVMMDSGSTTPVKYEYRLYASSASESDPIIIAPDSNPGTLRWHLVNVFAVSFQTASLDGFNRLVLSNNTSRSPAASSMEIYPEANIWKLNVNGTEYVLGPIDDTATNGDTTRVWSADKVFDLLALKAPLADPVFTGSTQLPNGANPTTDAAGEVAVDTSAGAGGGIRLYTDAAYTIPVYQTQCFTIKGPTATDDYRVWRSAQNITIRAAHCVQVGGTNVIGHFDECDANGANCATIDSSGDMTCLTTNVNDDGSLSNPTIDAGDYIQWHTTSVSGTITELIVCFDYTVNQVN